MGVEVPFLEVLDPSHPFLRVAHHLGEEVGEASTTQLRRACAVEVSVVDGFPVGRGAEPTPDLRGGAGWWGSRLLDTREGGCWFIS